MDFLGKSLLVISVALLWSFVSCEEEQIYSIEDLLNSTPKRNCLSRKLENGIVFPESTVYQSGTVVNYLCLPRFDLEGSQNATCDDGNWSNDLPKCDVKYVPPPGCSRISLLNGKVIPNKSSYKVRESVAFRCNDGFERDGASISICLDYGKWAFKTPTCKPVNMDCKKRKLQFGSVFPDKDVYKSRDVVVYNCDEGYLLKGEVAAACFEGKWTARLPVCEAEQKKKCPPPTFSHGSVYPIKKMYDELEVVRYNCESGYNLQGESTAACYKGKWTTDRPDCQRQFSNIVVYCAPPTIENGAFTPQQQRYSVGSVIKLRCKGKYNRVGLRQATCQENGEWTELPSCEIGCEEPRISNGYYNTQAQKTDSYFLRGSVLVFSCNPSYTLNGRSSITCGSQGTWLPALPSCRRNIVAITGCVRPSYADVRYEPTLPEHEEFYSVGDRIRFLCEGEKYPLGHNFAECLSNGKWSREPSCPTKCIRPRIANGDIDQFGDSFMHNTKITVTCDHGYLVVGSNTATCLYTGRWSSRLICSDGCYAPVISRMTIYPTPIGGGNVYELGKRISFRCDVGFSTSVSSAKCLGKDRWDKALPRCRVLNAAQHPRSGCAMPRLAPGLLLKNQHQSVFPYKTQFEFQCDKGYSMIGSAISICRKHLNGPLGGLDPQPPRCERAKCGSPGQPQNGGFRDGQKSAYYFGDTVYFVCNDKHIMSGNDHITCQADGQFNGIPPKCQPPSCRVECKYVGGRDCQCDATCRIRGDCCYDFEQHCRKLFY